VVQKNKEKERTRCQAENELLMEKSWRRMQQHKRKTQKIHRMTF